MTLYDYLKSAFRRCYTIDRFHDAGTRGTRYKLVQRGRDLGRLYFTDNLIAIAPSEEISHKINTWKESLVNHDLNQLPWDDYYAV